MPPAVTYEEVDVSGGSSGQREHNIELKSNEAYGPVQNTIVTTQNQAYGQVHLWPLELLIDACSDF